MEKSSDEHGKGSRDEHASGVPGVNNTRVNRRGKNYAEPTRTEAGNISHLEREFVALEHRRAGKTYRQIAALMGMGPNSQSEAYRLVKSAMDRMRAECNESAAQLRQQELDRLDGIWEPMYEAARAGDEKAASACVKISARRAALLGLDKPQQIEHTIAKTYAVRDASPDCPDWPRHGDGVALPAATVQDEEGDDGE